MTFLKNGTSEKVLMGISGLRNKRKNYLKDITVWRRAGGDGCVWRTGTRSFGDTVVMVHCSSADVMSAIQTGRPLTFPIKVLAKISW